MYKFDKFINSNYAVLRDVYKRLSKSLNFYNWLRKDHPNVIEEWELHAKVMEDQRMGRGRA